MKAAAALLLHMSWGLPQTLLGVVLLIIVRLADPRSWTFRSELATITTRTTLLGGGISLGPCLFCYDYSRRYGSASHPAGEALAVPASAVRAAAAARAQSRMDAHEWGHSIQALMLGPLYLIAVGVPSITRAAAARVYRRRLRRGVATRFTSNRAIGEWYYRGYPEAWADRLAGLERSPPEPL